MRNKKYEVTQREEIRAILEQCKVCRLGLHSGDDIYMVPLNFGYELLDTDAQEAGGLAAESTQEAGGLAAESTQEAGGLAVESARDAGGLAVESTRETGGLAVESAREAGGLAVESAQEAGGIGHGVLTLYFHCALEGRKLELLRKNARVGFELDGGHALIEGERACAYGYRYHSIVGTGTAALLEGAQEKAHALALLMKHQTGRDFSFTPQETASVAVLRVTADAFTAKRHG